MDPLTSEPIHLYGGTLDGQTLTDAPPHASSLDLEETGDSYAYCPSATAYFGRETWLHSSVPFGHFSGRLPSPQPQH
jgi:hypothetical protein